MRTFPNTNSTVYPKGIPKLEHLPKRSLARLIRRHNEVSCPRWKSVNNGWVSIILLLIDDSETSWNAVFWLTGWAHPAWNRDMFECYVLLHRLVTILVSHRWALSYIICKRPQFSRAAGFSVILLLPEKNLREIVSSEREYPILLTP